MAPTELAAGELELVLRQRWDRLVEIREPLALISQAPRSGGTLLMRLLDGHRRCHTMSQELTLDWPAIARPFDSGDGAWEAVGGTKLGHFLEHGIRPSRQHLNRAKDDLPFLTPPSFARAIFDRQLARSGGEPSPRDLLDAYFTAYFNAWLDNVNLLRGGKRWVTGFQPRIVASPEKLEAYWSAYPDGRLISIVRDPAGWFASARRWSTEWRQVDHAMNAWRAGTRAAVKAAEGSEGRVMLLTFDDLVSRTEKTMRRVTKFLGISLANVTLDPTFNGLPVRANSSFSEASAGVSAKTLTRGQHLEKDDLRYINEHARPEYDEFVALRRQMMKDASATAGATAAAKAEMLPTIE